MEYKFRGKRKDNGEWVYGYFWRMNDEMNGNKPCITVSVPGADNFFNHEIIPETVGIYFGWVDSEDTEIYTGDQLEIFWTDSESTRETISYSQEFGYFMYGNNPVCELVENKVKSKVVGNIHNVNPASGQAGVNYMINDPNAKAEQEGAGEAANAEASKRTGKRGTGQCNRCNRQ